MLKLKLLFALFICRGGLGDFQCGIDNETFAIAAFGACYPLETEPNKWTDLPSVDIKCEEDLMLEVNCSETSVTWTASFSNVIKFVGTCADSLGNYGEIFTGSNQSFSLPQMYSDCIFSACYHTHSIPGGSRLHYANSTVCQHPTTTMTTNPAEITTSIPLPELQYVHIERVVTILGVSLSLLTILFLAGLGAMLLWHCHSKRHLKNVSVKKVLHNSDVPNDVFEPMNIVRPVSSKSQQSICDPLYQNLKELHSRSMGPRIANPTNTYYQQHQSTSNSIDTPDGSTSLFYEDGENKVQTLSFRNRPNSLDLRQVQPFEKPFYYDTSSSNDSGYMDTESKGTATCIESGESNSSASSAVSLIDNLEKLRKLRSANRDVAGIIESRGCELAEANTVIPATDIPGELCGNGRNSYTGYLEHIDKLGSRSQFDHGGSINIWKSPYEEENVGLHKVSPCLDGNQ